MRSTALMYGVLLNDSRRDGSSAEEIYGALKAARMERLPARLAGPLAPAIVVLGDSIFAGALLREGDSPESPEAQKIKARVDAWWRQSPQARELKHELDLPDHLAPRLSSAQIELPELAEPD